MSEGKRSALIGLMCIIGGLLLLLLIGDPNHDWAMDRGTVEKRK